MYLAEFKNGVVQGIEIPIPAIENENDSLGRIRFGQSVYVGDSTLYISALGLNSGKGKVFAYPYISSSNRTDESPWTSFYTIQPDDLLENSHFGYQISEFNNQLAVSTFNQSQVYLYSKNQKNNPTS